MRTCRPPSVPFRAAGSTPKRSINVPMPITLVSPALCHYAQHTAIALSEKGVPFKRRIVHLSRKPDWFVAISPLGRTPVLKVGDGALFESAAILDYLGVTLPDPLHPKDPLERARDCASIGFGSECLSDIAGFYSARVAQTLFAWAASIHARLRVLEKQLGNAPWFGGDRFRPVDAVFPPVFRYSDTFEAIGDFGISDGLGKVPEWRPNLATWTSVLDAVGADYGERLERFIKRKGGALAGRLPRYVSQHTPSDFAGAVQGVD